MKIGKFDITLENIQGYIQGNFRYFMLKCGFKSNYILEQFYYRIILMREQCLINRECPCGCHCLAKQIENRGCDEHGCYPNMLSKKDWESFKKLKNLDMSIIRKEAISRIKKYNYNLFEETKIIIDNE